MVCVIRRNGDDLKKLGGLKISEGYWSYFSLSKEKPDYPVIDGSISFTQESFKIKATVEDLHFKDGERSWRYGDGFLINFITKTYPDLKPSPHFYAYGFSIMAGIRHSTLVCHDGKYYLYSEDFKPNIIIDEKEHKAYYDIQVPWSKLAPFHPLIDKTLGINIRYASQNDDGTSTRLYLVEDDEFDSETVLVKNYKPLHLQQSDKSKTQFTFELENNLVYYPESSIYVTLYSETKRKIDLTIRILDDSLISKKMHTLVLNKGIQRIPIKFLAPTKTGIYRLEILMDEQKHIQEFFRLPSDEIPKLEERVHNFEKIAQTPLEKSSLYGLVYKLNDFKESLKKFNPRDKVIQIKNSLDVLDSLSFKVQEQGHIYGEYQVRTAFKSPDDETLQPYSIALPPSFSPEIEYKLFFCLHGSGVNEVGFFNNVLNFREAIGDDYIFVAPRGRDLSDWYVGQTEKDLIHLLKTLKNMFTISRTVIYGFSMGGYGVWRTTFLHPNLFDSAIVGSGSPLSPSSDKPELDVRQMRHTAKNIPYLIMHGTEDRAVNYENSKEFANTLKTEGFDITFKSFDGAGHGNYNPKETIIKWMKLYG